jgi:hypothetical protein
MLLPSGTPSKVVAGAAPAVAFKADTAQQRATATTTPGPQDQLQAKIYDNLSTILQIQSVWVTENNEGSYTVAITYKTNARTSQDLVDEWMVILRPLSQLIAQQELGVGEVDLLLTNPAGEQMGKFSTVGLDLLSFEAQKITRADFLRRSKYETDYKPAQLKPTPTNAPAAR